MSRQVYILDSLAVERAYSRTTDRSNIGRIRSVSFINFEHISLICYDVCTDKYEEMSRKHLYTPSEMYDWTTHHHLSKSHHPCEEQLTEDAPGSFPYPVPKWIPPTPSQAKAVSAEFQHMKLAPLVTAPLRTLKNSTAPAKKVEALYLGDRELKQLRFCSKILGRLARYALAPGQALLNETEYPPDGVLRTPLDGSSASSWSDQNTREAARSSLPSPRQQAKTLERLAPLYIAQRLRPPAVVNSEIALQHEIYTQLLDVTNTWVNVRSQSPWPCYRADHSI